MKKVHEFIRSIILQVIDFFYPLFRKFFSLQTFRYAACGGVNTVLDIGLFAINYNFILKKHEVVLGTVTISPHIAAMLLALCISLPTGFYLNRYVVFQKSGLRRRSQLFRYVLVVIICICLNYIFLKLFVEVFGWYPTLSKITTTAIVVVFSYISQTFYFFKKKPQN
jgi:putative flippase GtrA